MDPFNPKIQKQNLLIFQGNCTDLLAIKYNENPSKVDARFVRIRAMQRKCYSEPEQINLFLNFVSRH